MGSRESCRMQATTFRDNVEVIQASQEGIGLANTQAYAFLISDPLLFLGTCKETFPTPGFAWLSLEG